MKSLRPKPTLSANGLLQLERCGRYNEAIQALGEIWQDKSAFPDTSGLDRCEAAEIILRCGSLIGFLGHNEQIPDSQEKSKNLLTEAHRRFLDIYDVEKIAECENYLALAYWRSGELGEAETWVDEALSRSLPESSFVRLYAVITKSGNLLTGRKYEEAVELLEANETACLRHGDECLKGDLYNHLGLALKNLGRIPEALASFESAREHHWRSGHMIYLGTVENNIAQLCRMQGEFRKAHRAIDNSSEIFRKIKADARYGFSLDTKALIYLEQGLYKEALETVDQAIEILGRGENAEFLVETWATRIRIQIRQNRIADAALTLSEAVHVARTKISETKARSLTEDFARAVSETRVPVITAIHTEKESEDGRIELVLPPELSHHRDIQGVWIKNAYLEEAGLKRDSLAVVAPGKVGRGDLIAVLEHETQAVVCGFYDYDFGILCLERSGGEPQLYNENEIEILGRIVGVADQRGETEGRMQVRPLEPPAV